MKDTASTTGAGSRHKILVVVSGEASSELALEWARAGELPHLQRMMQQGVAGTVQAPEPFITAQLWGTLLTGLAPGRHGLFDFMQRGSDGRFRETDAQALRAPPVWQFAQDAGLRSGVVNLPFTFPPAPLTGFMLSGQDAPGAHRSIAAPPELYDELVRRFGEYPLKSIFPGGRQKADYLSLIDRDYARWIEIMAHLARTRPCDLMMCYVGATAMAQHYFWGDMVSGAEDNPYRNVVKSAFVGLDHLVGRLAQEVGPETTIFVVSESGAGPLLCGVDVNAFLAQEGFLTFGATAGKESARRDLFGRLRLLAQTHVPQSLKTALLRGMRPIKGWLMNRFDSADIDWHRTRAFSRGEEGQVFINLRGREPHGVVAQGEEYDRVREEIAACLLALRDPETGEHAVTAVHKREDVLDGPYREEAPDLIVNWRDGEYMPNETAKRSDQIFGERWREGMRWPTTGSHRSTATFFAAGPAIAPGATFPAARLMDLAPTWLSCLGLAPPPEMQGRVLHEILRRAPAASLEVNR